MPLTDAFAEKALRWLLVVNAAASLAAAVVLATAPGAIPAAVGVALERSQYLIAYLLAAAELSISTVCVLALRSKAATAIGQAVRVLIVFHAASGLAGLAAMARGASPSIAWNVAVRLAMIAALAWFAGKSRAASAGEQ
jgi:hypothetical protein